jgi:hypothetical protein
MWVIGSLLGRKVTNKVNSFNFAESLNESAVDNFHLSEFIQVLINPTTLITHYFGMATECELNLKNSKREIDELKDTLKKQQEAFESFVPDLINEAIKENSTFEDIIRTQEKLLNLERDNLEQEQLISTQTERLISQDDTISRQDSRIKYFISGVGESLNEYFKLREDNLKTEKEFLQTKIDSVINYNPS